MDGIQKETRKCCRCGAEGDSEWYKYDDSLKRIKGEELSEALLTFLVENDVVYCELCKVKLFQFITGITLFVPPEVANDEENIIVGIEMGEF